MENYDILLNKIKEFLNKKEIKEEDTNVEVISLYDLYNIVNEELKDLRDIMTDSKISKKIQSSKLIAPIFNRYLYSETNVIENKPRIEFVKETNDGLRWGVDTVLLVYKENDVDELHLSEERNGSNKCFYSFIKRNYDLILETLTKLEYYINLLGDLNYKSSLFEHELFSAKLSYKSNGEVFVNLDLKSDHPLYDEYHKNWYRRENIHNYTEKHLDEVLKRIPVLPYELKGPYKSIYEKYLENTKNKEKQLVLK